MTPEEILSDVVEVRERLARIAGFTEDDEGVMGEIGDIAWDARKLLLKAQVKLRKVVGE